MLIYSPESLFLTKTSHSPYARLHPVPLPAVTLREGFWSRYHQVNRMVSLPAQYHQFEETGRLDNFRRAAGKVTADFKGYYFNDSDVYKWLEAAAWSLIEEDSPELKEMINQVVPLIESAQRDDGYLNTYFTFERADQRWTDLEHKHELYCAGHLIQAAVAHFRVTGSPRLFKVAKRIADHIINVFGPRGRVGLDGHPEIELALVELFRTTKDSRYLELAASFVDRRGYGLLGGKEYSLDHIPLRQMERLTGHAVRAMYLCAGAADIYLETGELALLQALERLWQHMTSHQMYITGGVGSRHDGEGIGADYELPNATAYAETCAAIGSVMWNWRMLQISGDARYSDLIEWTLFNAVLPGVSLDGLKYHYVNPLACDSSHPRQAWFDCACCPPNLSRMVATLPAMMYSTSAEGVWVHQYAQGCADLVLPEGKKLGIQQTTRYPWDGRVELELLPSPETEACETSLFLRIPGWVEGSAARLSLNDQVLEERLTPGTYSEIRRAWKLGDRVQIDLPMPVRYQVSHPYIDENVNRVAVTRGPLLYCAEAADNPDLTLRDFSLQEDGQTQPRSIPDLLEGMVQLELPGMGQQPNPGWQDSLYRPYPSTTRQPGQPQLVKFIPYFAWGNRQPGAMQIWFPIWK